MGNEYEGQDGAGGAMPPLEVSVNTEEKYSIGEGQLGRITKMLDGSQQERYLNGKFRNLVKYVLSDESGFNEEQELTCRAVREKVGNESDTSRVIINLYDENDHLMDDEFMSQGEIYLDDIVREKVGGEPEIVRMSISTWSSVGAYERG